MKKLFAMSLLAGILSGQLLMGHCQMPCGIYHDDMVFDQIDQYVETMVKAVAKIKENKSSTPQEKNEYVRWIMSKDHQSDDAAQLIMSFFLQQKIKPGEEDTLKKIESAHKLLFSIVTIKQTVDFKAVSDFGEEWEKFKLMFHIQGYECEMEKRHLKLWEEKRKEYEAKAKAEQEAKSSSTNKPTSNSKESPSEKEKSDRSVKGA